MSIFHFIFYLHISNVWCYLCMLFIYYYTYQFGRGIWYTCITPLKYISAISRRSVQTVKETGVSGEIMVITKWPNSEQSYKGKVKTHKYINRQNQSTTGKLWKRNDPDLVQAFLKKWWIESDFKAPNLPLSLRLKVSGCYYNSIYNNTWTKQVKQLS